MDRPRLSYKLLLYLITYSKANMHPQIIILEDKNAAKNLVFFALTLF